LKKFFARAHLKKKKFLRALSAERRQAAGAGFCPSGQKFLLKKGSHFVQ
jgi:hypothetical protein